MNVNYSPATACPEPKPEGWLLRWFTILCPRTVAYGRLGMSETAMLKYPRGLWLLAIRVEMRGCPIPPIDNPADRLWVGRAVDYLRFGTGSKISAPILRAVRKAEELRHSGANLPMAAALLSKGGTVEAVAAAACLDPLAVEAFSILFFNPRSRRFGSRRKTARICLDVSRGEPAVQAEEELIRTGLNGTLAQVLELAKRQGLSLFQSPAPQETLP